MEIKKSTSSSKHKRVLSKRFMGLIEYSHIDIIDLCTKEIFSYPFSSENLAELYALINEGLDISDVKCFKTFVQIAHSASDLADDNVPIKLVETLDNGFRWMNGWLANRGKEIFEHFETISASRQWVDHRYCQTPMLPEATFRKALFILETFAPERVLLIGDDDLLSIAMLIVNNNVKIDVLEIDSQLCRFIHTHLPNDAIKRVKLINKSIFESIDELATNCYDIVAAETISHYASMLTFVSKAVDAVKIGGRVIIPPVTSVRHSSMTKRIVNELGLEVEFHSIGFGNYMNEYYELAPFRTDLLTARRTSFSTKLPFQLKERCQDQMYRELEQITYDYDVEVIVGHTNDALEKLSTQIRHFFIVNNHNTHFSSEWNLQVFDCKQCLIYICHNRATDRAVLHIRNSSYLNKNALYQLLTKEIIAHNVRILPRSIS